MKNLYFYLTFGLSLATQLGLSPSLAAQESKLGQAVIDSTLVEARMFKVIGDRSEALADLPSSFPVVTLYQKSVDGSGTVTYAPLSFAVNCKGRDPRAALNAFGESFLELDNPEVISEQDLNDAFNVTSQPVLRCDALTGANQGAPLFSQFFRVIDRTAKKSYHLVRFNSFSPLDKPLYQLGCSNIADTFWKETADRKIIPVLKENLKDLPGFDNLGSLHCYDTATPVTDNLTYGKFLEPEPVFDARAYRVEDPEKGLVRVLITSGKTFRLNCSSTDKDLQIAFGLPATGNLPVITTADPAFNDYLNGQMDSQPALTCPTISRPQFASEAYHVINLTGLDARSAAKNPLLRLSAAEDSLVQFSCESATNFFAKKLIDELNTTPGKLQPMTWESSDYLVRKYLPGQLTAKRYQIGCAAGALPAAIIKQLIRDIYGREPESGEVSLHMNQCSREAEACTTTFMEQKIVERAMASPQSIARIIIRAFADRASPPQPEELNYFMRKANASGRVHFKELQAYLKTAKFLDRSLFITATTYGTNAEIFMDAMDVWTARQFDNPSKVYTVDLFKSELNPYLKATHAEELARRVYQYNFWTGSVHMQTNSLKAKITSGGVNALYQDIVNLLKNTGADCVKVESTKEIQTFSFFKPHWKVTTTTGTWSVNKATHPMVTAAGHGPEYSDFSRLDMRFPLGRLLLSIKDDNGQWGPWDGWTAGKGYDRYVTEIRLLMNDVWGGFGDNNGSISICFE